MASGREAAPPESAAPMVIRSALAPELCALLAAKVGFIPYASHVRTRPELVQGLVNAIGPFLIGVPGRLAFLPEVTSSWHHHDWHRDSPKGATHKVCIYLDPGDAGTGVVFRPDEVTIAPAGSVIIFPIGYEHRSSERRMVLGMRAVLHASANAPAARN